MQVRPIKTDADHDAALRRIERLWGAAEGSDDGDRLDVLADLVEAYERRRWPLKPLDPVEAIEAAMAMNGYTQAELAQLIGPPRASEILTRKRPLTLAMIRAISLAWHVPAQLLVGAYPTSARAAAGVR